MPRAFLIAIFANAADAPQRIRGLNAVSRIVDLIEIAPTPLRFSHNPPIEGAIKYSNCRRCRADD